MDIKKNTLEHQHNKFQVQSTQESSLLGTGLTFDDKAEEKVSEEKESGLERTERTPHPSGSDCMMCYSIIDY